MNLFFGNSYSKLSKFEKRFRHDLSNEFNRSKNLLQKKESRD